MMHVMLLQYNTVNKKGEAEYVIQKSRFIGYVKRTETEAEAQAFIQLIKKKHYDATHNCSAYLIGEQDQIQKANDDGEPSGTAGFPMLEVLKKQQLKDTTIVVTRFFGGVKLGAGGLIRAYGHTTSLALKATGTVQRQLMQGFTITVDYKLLGSIENILRSEKNYILDSIQYDENVHILVYAPADKATTFKEWIVDLTSDTAKIIEADKKYIETQL